MDVGVRWRLSGKVDVGRGAVDFIDHLDTRARVTGNAHEAVLNRFTRKELFKKVSILFTQKPGHCHR